MIENIKTIGDVFKKLGGVLYFIDKEGIEIEDCEVILPNSMKVLNIITINDNEYEIQVDK